jgi:hypothetical protein
MMRAGQADALAAGRRGGGLGAGKRRRRARPGLSAGPAWPLPQVPAGRGCGWTSGGAVGLPADLAEPGGSVTIMDMSEGKAAAATIG